MARALTKEKTPKTQDNSNRIKTRSQCCQDNYDILLLLGQLFFPWKKGKYNMRRSNFGVVVVVVVFCVLRTMIYNTGIRRKRKKNSRSMYGRYFSFICDSLFSLHSQHIAFLSYNEIAVRFVRIPCIDICCVCHIPTFYWFWSFSAILLCFLRSTIFCCCWLVVVVVGRSCSYCGCCCWCLF